jgi:hypothetical protein
MEIFSQIQDMDDDDDDDGEGGGHEFSKSIVWGYFEQAENTFKQMEEAMCVYLPWSFLASDLLLPFTQISPSFL